MPIKGLGRVFQGGASGKIDSLSTKLDALPGKPTVSQLYGFLDPNKGTKPRQLTFYLEKIRTLNLINHGLGENILRDFDQRVEQLTNRCRRTCQGNPLLFARRNAGVNWQGLR